MTIQDLKDFKLKPRQRLFCLYYAAGDEETALNPKTSYQKAYTKKDKIPDDKYATDNGNRLLQEDEVSRCIQFILKKAQAKTDTFNSYLTLRTIEVCSNWNISDYLDDRGILKIPLSELGELAKAIEDVTPVFSEDEFMGLKVKFCKREKFLELMMKYLELIRPEENLETSDSSIVLVNPLQSETGYEQLVYDTLTANKKEA